MGSINHLSPGDDFDELSSDVDVVIVVHEGAVDVAANPAGQFVLSGPCLIQLVFGSFTADDPDRLLGGLGVGSNLLTSTILDDPEGVIERSARLVRAEWAKPEWVGKRTARALEFIDQAVDAAQTASEPVARLAAISEITTQLGGVIAIAHARRPTHRKSLILAREILRTDEPVDRILAAAGAGDIDLDTAQAAISDAGAALKLESRYPHPSVAHDPQVQERFIEQVPFSQQELLDSGHFAEALLNASGEVAMCAMTIHDHGTPDERSEMDAMVHDRLAGLSALGPNWPQRASALADVVMQTTRSLR